MVSGKVRGGAISNRRRLICIQGQRRGGRHRTDCWRQQLCSRRRPSRQTLRPSAFESRSAVRQARRGLVSITTARTKDEDVRQASRKVPTSSVIFDQNALLTYLVLPWSLITSLPNFLLTVSVRCVRLPELELKLYRYGRPSPSAEGDSWPCVFTLSDLSPRVTEAGVCCSEALPSASGEFPLLEWFLAVSTSIWPLSSSTIPSNFRRRFINSISRSLDGCLGGALGSFGRGRRGARPGAGKIHGICARRQLEHGMCLSHRTFLLLQVTQLRGFRRSEGVAVGV